MIKLNVYLNFPGTTEEAFVFYKSIFGGEFDMLQRFRDVKDLPDREKFSEADLNKIMHIALPVGGLSLMGTDALESMGQHLTMGDNVNLSLHPETKEEAERLFAGLAEGGKVGLPLTEMFWNTTFGMLTDKFGVQWMFNVDHAS